MYEHSTNGLPVSTTERPSSCYLLYKPILIHSFEQFHIQSARSFCILAGLIIYIIDTCNCILFLWVNCQKRGDLFGRASWERLVRVFNSDECAVQLGEACTLKLCKAYYEKSSHLSEPQVV